jgi:hypothetical protein
MTATGLTTNDVENTGFKDGSLSPISSIVMGAASTVPDESLAARLGFIGLMIGLLVCAVLMFLWFLRQPEFFLGKTLPRRSPEVAPRVPEWATPAPSPELES